MINLYEVMLMTKQASRDITYEDFDIRDEGSQPFAVSTEIKPPCYKKVN